MIKVLRKPRTATTLYNKKDAFGVKHVWLRVLMQKLLRSEYSSWRLNNYVKALQWTCLYGTLTENWTMKFLSYTFIVRILSFVFSRSSVTQFWLKSCSLIWICLPSSLQRFLVTSSRYADERPCLFLWYVHIQKRRRRTI